MCGGCGIPLWFLNVEESGFGPRIGQCKIESIRESKARQSNRNRNKRANVCIVYSMEAKQVSNSNPVGADIRGWWW
jgi:hypothetical protein